MLAENDLAAKKKANFVRLAVLVALLIGIGFSFLQKNSFPHTFGLLAIADETSGKAEESLRQHIESESGGQIKLTSFKKTDGQATKVFGVDGYNLSFEGEITFVSDGVWLKNNVWVGSGLTFSFSKKTVGSGGMNGATQVHAGDKVKIGGVMAGQKSEKGWSFDVADVHTIN